MRSDRPMDAGAGALHNDRVLYLAASILAYVPLWFAAPYRPQVVPFLLGLIPPFLLLLAGRRAVRSGSFSLRWLLVAGLALRLGFMAQAPSLSEDVYRYFWDGSLAAAGKSPFLAPPLALPEWRAETPELYARMAHLDRRTVYPPLAQSLFALQWILWADSVAGWRLLLLLSEAALVALFLRGFRVAPDRLALWVLHPLVVVEFYSSGHLDLFALAGLATALWLLGRSGRRAAGAAGAWLGAAAMVKIFPAFFLPLAWRCCGGKRAGLFLAAFVLSAGAVSLPLLLWTGSPLESLRSLAGALSGFHADWRFNSLPFFLLQPQRRIAGVVASALFAAVVVTLAWRPFRSSSPAAGSVPPQEQWEQLATRGYFLLCAFHLLAHTVHPWYTTWILLFYPLLGLRYRAGFWLASVSSASYLAYAGAVPGETPWVLGLEYVPYYLLLLRDLRAYHQDRNGRETSIRHHSAGG